MEEIKHMLEALHEENKDILTLLWGDIYEADTLEKLRKAIDDKFDKIFYGNKECKEGLND